MILNSSPIHANKIMNQNMDPTTPQKSMSYSFIEVDFPSTHHTDARPPLRRQQSRRPR
jgi:hypothetical protein